MEDELNWPGVSPPNETEQGIQILDEALGDWRPATFPASPEYKELVHANWGGGSHGKRPIE